jgi:hypothetical protein
MEAAQAAAGEISSPPSQLLMLVPSEEEEGEGEEGLAPMGLTQEDEEEEEGQGQGQVRKTIGECDVYIIYVNLISINPHIPHK